MAPAVKVTGVCKAILLSEDINECLYYKSTKLGAFASKE
jgi:hypothetical protein